MTVHVFPAMGTMVSLTVEYHGAEAQDLVEAIFADADGTFSLYRPDSELSLLNSGDGLLMGASATLRRAYELAVSWRRRTGGAFSPTRPDGLLDLNGVVKAIAMRQSGEALDTLKCGEWSLVVGGDVAVSRSRARAHIVGVADPFVSGRLLCAVALESTRRAVATSGSAERGDHIWKAGSAAGYRQVTVLADDIVTADVLATSIVAGGAMTLELATSTERVDVLVVDDAGSMMATPGFRSALAPAAASSQAASTRSRLNTR